MKLAAILFLIGIAIVSAAEKIETLRLEPAPNMTRAELHFVETVPSPKAVLVLCPGSNGSAENQIRANQWIDFAKNHDLGLVGLSFASPESALHDDTGYYYVSEGSGEKLLEGIRRIFGKDLPLLLYGISGGAHFTSRFEQWKPNRVLTWCAYSAGWWDKPHSSPAAPPGIVACGDEDGRYGASLIYFKQGRAAGNRWLWVSLPKTGHSYSPELDDFVRNYFATILSSRTSRPSWVDIDQEEALPPGVEIHPALSAWLPSEKLFDQWRKIHEP